MAERIRIHLNWTPARVELELVNGPDWHGMKGTWDVYYNDNCIGHIWQRRECWGASSSMLQFKERHLAVGVLVKKYEHRWKVTSADREYAMRILEGIEEE